MAGSSYLSLMYGRGNIFSSSNNSSGNSYGNNSNNSNNSYNNSYSNSYNNSTRLGSNRLDYRYEEPPSYLCSMMHQWRQQPPSSIVTREETLHLTPTELRIEDYHCMRKQQIRSSLETRLKEAIHKEAFNPEILKFQFEHLPPVSSERPPDLDAIRSGRYGSGNSGGNGGNIFSGGSSNNGNGSSGNIFSRNNNGYSGNSGGYSGGNGGSSGGGNIFSGGSNNYNNYGSNNNSNNNIFSGGNNRSGYNSNSNNNNSNNIFSGGSSSGGSGNNIFSRGSNNSTGNNIFSSGNQNNSSSNNIFSRGNSSSNNNIFSSNNNNNNGNIFSSNRGGGGNNLFSNNSTSNNNNNSAINQELLLNLKMIMDSNQTFMRQMAQQLQLTPHQEEPPAPQSPFDQLLKHQPLKEIDRLFPEKPKQEEVVIIQPPWVDNYRQQLASSRITNNSRTIGQINSKTNLNEAEKGNRGFGGSRLYLNNQAGGSRLYLNNQPGGSRLFLNNQPGGSQLINSQTVRCNNFPQQTVTNSISESHISRPINSKLSIRGPLHQNNPPFQPELPFSECGCQCLFTLAVEWKDDQYNELPHSTLAISLQLPNLEPNRPEWRQNVIALLKERKEVIRRDAQMTFTSGIQRQNHCYELVGILNQNIVNLGQEYRISYHQIRSFHLHNLTISNSYGSISWEKPIPLTNLDFTNTPEGPPFELADNTINCELLALNSPCRVTFFSLPPHITEIYRKDPEQARSAFSDFVSKSSEGAFKLEEIWEEGNDRGWSMFVVAFPQVPQEM